MEAVAEQELSVVLSSHLVADLERVCDYLIVLIGSQVRIAGPVDELLAAHHLLTGPRRDPDTLPDNVQVVSRQPHRRADHAGPHRRQDLTLPGPFPRSALRTLSSAT